MFDFLKNIFVFLTGALSIITSPFVPVDKINPIVSPAPVVQEVKQTPTPTPTTAPIIYKKEVKGIQSTPTPTATVIPTVTPTATPTPTPTPTPTQRVNTDTPIDIQPTIPQSNSRSDAYWDFQLKQAEKEAKEAEEARKTREAYDQQCKELTTQRNTALEPLEAQITETKNKLWTVEERINERIKGFLVNESQRLRMIEAETHDLQNQLNKLQNEYNAIYSQYGSC